MKKAVVISGAGSGIGAATALEFSKNDYYVILLGRQIDKLNATLKTLPTAGHSIVCDLNQVSSVENAVSEALKLDGVSIEALVNNAGVYSVQPFIESTEEEWLRQFNTNLFGAVRLTRAFWKHFVKNKKGSIVNISSTLGTRPVAGTSVYSASKAAMDNLTKTLALEGGPYNIRCNGVSPGIIDTPIHSFHNLDKSAKTATLEKMKGLQPLQRIGTPEEVARAVYFLGSDQSSWTTGAILHVDGGINLQ